EQAEALFRLHASRSIFGTAITGSILMERLAPFSFFRITTMRGHAPPGNNRKRRGSSPSILTPAGMVSLVDGLSPDAAVKTERALSAGEIRTAAACSRRST